jgi:hypothetical protein
MQIDTVIISLNKYNELIHNTKVINSILYERKAGKLYCDLDGIEYPEYILKEKDDLFIEMQSEIKKLRNENSMLIKEKFELIYNRKNFFQKLFKTTKL